MLEDMINLQELREKQLDHRFQLAIYQEKRMSELDALKGKNFYHINVPLSGPFLALTCLVTVVTMSILLFSSL